MLTIRPAQLQAFSQFSRERFRERLADSLRDFLPVNEWSADPERLHNEADSAIKLAAEFHLTSEVHVAGLAALLCTHFGGITNANLPKETLNLLLAHGVDPDEKLNKFAAAQNLDEREGKIDDRFSSSPIGEPVRACPLAGKAKPVHWISIKLVGEDNRPITWEEYTVRLPNGTLVRGFLDGVGRAKVEGIEAPGTCRISFPKLDRDAWTPIESVTQGPAG